MSGSLTLRLVERAGDETVPVPLEVDELVIAGWTGSDLEAVEKHIKELEEIGVPRPATVPCFFRVSAHLLTTRGEIQVSGTGSTGEVEFVLFGTADGMMVGVGSDHTDREVESYSITVSKQMCAKPVAPEAWRIADVAGHWDDLVLRSWTVRGGERALYQDGPVTAMRAPADLIGRYTGGGAVLPAGTVMFCGTLAAHGEIAFAERFEIELEDPVLGRSLRHGYTVNPLPVDS